MTNKIKMVIGSYGSYNACNARALGSSWLCLSDYDTWEEIEEELKEQGFDLNGIDEELFIQDYEGLPRLDEYEHPKRVFETLKESGALEDEHKYNAMMAYCEYYDFNAFTNEVNSHGDRFDDYFTFYEGRTLQEIADELADEQLEGVPEFLRNYFDYQAYARDLSFDGYYETEYGVIVF